MNCRIFVAASVLGALVAGCGDGSTPSTAGTDSTPTCSGSCASSATFLAVTDVEKIIAQGVAEAKARNLEATIAVVDRVGNVLAVYRMGAASDPGHQVVIASALDSAGRSPISAGLEGLRLPLPQDPTLGTALSTVNIDELAAIAKAVTGAYLSTEGNAFTTTTASQIIESHFNPGELGQPAGPLFGVQFSQLPCSDFSQRYNPAIPAGAGPHRSPLGLAGDPGGFPLYLGGTVVGGVGVIADGVYGLDDNPPACAQRRRRGHRLCRKLRLCGATGSARGRDHRQRAIAQLHEPHVRRAHQQSCPGTGIQLLAGERAHCRAGLYGRYGARRCCLRSAGERHPTRPDGLPG